MLLCSDTQLDVTPVVPDLSNEDQVRSLARSVMSRAGAPRSPVAERRTDTRQPFPYPFQLTPLVDGQPIVDDTFAVLGKHMSERGIDFYHTEPISERRVIATFENSGAVQSMLLELTWCRFGQHGWYENGGRFLKLVESPLP